MTNIYEHPDSDGPPEIPGQAAWRTCELKAQRMQILDDAKYLADGYRFQEAYEATVEALRIDEEIMALDSGRPPRKEAAQYGMNGWSL